MTPPGPRIGELFAGYGGLGMGVKAATGGGEVVWVSEIDPGACKVLAHHYPDAPNLGDITTVDWSQVESVDVLTGGFPCQDVSTAGMRAGMRPGTRSGLWEHFAYAIDQLRPPLVVIENVRGLLSAQAHSDVEPCPWCVGDNPDGAMRALGAVLADLADIGYDAVWCGLRAADVGGCHGRFRVFVAAHPGGEHGGQWRELASGQASGGRALGEPARRGRAPAALLPTPRATDGTNGGPNQRGSVAKLLPTPTVSQIDTKATAEEWAEKTRKTMGRGLPAATLSLTEAMRFMHTKESLTRFAMLGESLPAGSGSFGEFTGAISRWEHVLERPAPDPTEVNPKNGRSRLSTRFEEWMMGLPDGWITDVPGVTWQEAVRMCGNGVVPQQAEAATRWLLSQTLDIPPR